MIRAGGRARGGASVTVDVRLPSGIAGVAASAWVTATPAGWRRALFDDRDLVDLERELFRAHVEIVVAVVELDDAGEDCACPQGRADLLGDEREPRGRCLSLVVQALDEAP